VCDRRRTRRSVLRLLGVASVGSLAGCPGSSTDAETVTPVRVPTNTAGTPTTLPESQRPLSTLRPADADDSDEFGEAMALSADGTIALIGAPADEDPNGRLAGSAYVFESTADGWRQRAKLAAEDGDSFGAFGCAVALSSDGATALLGAESADTDSGDRAGSAYVFQRVDGSWTQAAKLTALDGESGDAFGCAVALSNDGTAALVGACDADGPSGTLAGSVAAFEVDDGTWRQTATLAPGDGDGFDNFGESVALSADGTTAVAGAPADEDPNGRLAGSAYIFQRTDGAWTQRAKLAPEDGERQDFFGRSVAVSDDGSTVLAGAYGDEAGSAYVFDVEADSWTQRYQLTPEDGDPGDFFGFDVRLTGDGATAVVGAPGADSNDEAESGVAYIFETGVESWTQTAKLVAAAGERGDFFGRGVGVSADGTTALVGAPFDTTAAGEFAGTASVFTPSSPG
jgi:hypothetical protein